MDLKNIKKQIRMEAIKMIVMNMISDFSPIMNYENPKGMPKTGRKYKIGGNSIPQRVGRL
jgi:hypothetical protein